MLRFTPVANAREIPVRRCRLVVAGDQEVALWHLEEGKFCAINNVCPHQHFSKLHEGVLEGEMLSCPMHGWTFNLNDGSERDGKGRARIYPVRIEGDEILIGIPVEPDLF